MYIAQISINLPEEVKFNHVGWRVINNKHVYLDGMQAIGSENVDLKSSMNLYIKRDYSLLPEIAWNYSLNMLNISHDVKKTLPLWLYTHIAVIKELFKEAGAEPLFLMWIYGETGAMKTSIAKMFCNIFNRDQEIISATFKDTVAGVELKYYDYKDSVLLLDDFHPTNSYADKKQMETLASNVIRAYGDGIYKTRGSKYMKKQKEFPPRGLCTITGEDILGGHSNIARCIGIEVARGTYNCEILKAHQMNPLIFSTHLYHFIKWVALNYDDIVNLIRSEYFNFRQINQGKYRHLS